MSKRQQAEPPSLVWIAATDSASLVQQANGVAQRLVATVKELRADATAEPDSLHEAIDKVLRLGAGMGDFTLDRDGATKLALPAALLVEQTGSAGRHAQALGLLNARTAELDNKLLRDKVSALLAEVTPPDATVSEQSEAPVAEDVLATEAAPTTSPPEPDPGVVDRSSLSPEDRASHDLSRLQSGAPIPVNLAEAMYADDEIWETTALREWVSTLSGPIDADVHDPASAALLNARLRRMRIRMFLRHPSALVIDSVTSQIDVTPVRREFARDVIGPIMNALHVIGEELTLPRPRKGPIDAARMNIENLLPRMDLALGGKAGDRVPFDPIEHVPVEPVDVGAEVAITRPSVRDAVTGEVIVKGQVVGVVHESAAGTTEDGAEAVKQQSDRSEDRRG